MTNILQSLKALVRGTIGVIPPHDLTVTRMSITELRIKAYWREHGKLPASLDELPALPGRDSSVIDGWGQPIRYAAAGTSVTLASLNPDAGDDITVTFDATLDR
jgi:hypothetical protein